ncbi:MAG: cation transporter [Christensenellaceae bacterium]|jgi:Co/Zn/Cd efflux system component|nr:cation transporter [Christensenellaceae bacterium]
MEKKINAGTKTQTEKKVLIIVFALNFAFFAIELATGLISNSLGLITDSADMFADALIYGLSLFALGKAFARKKRIAFTQCGLQTVLIAFVGFEIVRRFIFETPLPDYKFMIIVSAFAFIANLTSLLLLRKLNSNDTNIKASEICSRVDCGVNLGVIVGGILVLIFESKLPDLIISSLIFVWAARELIEMYMTASRGEVGCGCNAHEHPEVHV